MGTRILVTGATGFVGHSLCHFLITREYDVRGTVRKITGDLQDDWRGCKGDVDIIDIGDILPDTDWSQALRDVDTIVHLAARVHVTNDNFSNSLDQYRNINTVGTANLARQAVAAGVRRFVYLSTVKVNGEGSSFASNFLFASGNNEIPAAFSETNIPNPQGGYAISKWEAEQELKHISSSSGMEIVIVRPPLIYGEGVKANFMSLLKLIDMGVPLPFGSLANRRSLLSLDNLLDFLVQCIQAPSAANETFLVADDEVLSTPELIRKIAFYMKRPARLPAFHVGLIKATARLFGKSTEIDKICGSLQLDTSKAREVLQWKPPLSIDQGLKKTVLWYLKAKKKHV